MASRGQCWTRCVIYHGVESQYNRCMGLFYLKSRQVYDVKTGWHPVWPLFIIKLDVHPRVINRRHDMGINKKSEIHCTVHDVEAHTT